MNAWGEVAMLTATDHQPRVVFDAFGQSVSISDSIAIVGASSLDAAYVFRRDLGGPTAWGEVAKLTASDFSSPIAFGQSVSVSGGTAIIGAPGVSGSREGTAYVFTRAAEDNWGPVQKLLPGGLAAHSVVYFGGSVAIDGDRAIVGAFNDDETGTAFVFGRQDDSNVWERTVTLTPGRPNERVKSPTGEAG